MNMECPKCHHRWKKEKKSKFNFPYHETGPERVFAQSCAICEKAIKAGTTAMACTTIPESVHKECLKSAQESGKIARWAQFQEVKVI